MWLAMWLAAAAAVACTYRLTLLFLLIRRVSHPALQVQKMAQGPVNKWAWFAGQHVQLLRVCTMMLIVVAQNPA
jgi:hypothetical protein